MKAVLFITVLLFFTAGAVITFNEPEAAGQQPLPVKVPDSEAKFDSAISRVERKVDRAEKYEPPKERIRIIYRDRPVGFYRQITEGIYVTDTAVYSFPVKTYNGIAIIDATTLQESINSERDSVIAEAPLYVDTLIDEANQHISAWQSVRNFISKTFKKKR